MKYLAATAVAFVSIVPSFAAVTIDTPFNVVQCQPQMLTFRGSPPYYLSIIPGGQPSAAPLRTFPKQSENSLTVLTDFASGTPVTYVVKDSTGETGFSDTVIVQKSSDNSCLGSTPASQALLDNGNTVKPSPQGPTPSTPATKPGSGAGAAAPAVAGPGPASAIQPALTVTTTRPIGGIQAVSSTVSSPLATPTLAASGAESRFTISNLGSAAILGLVGAFLL